MEVPIEKEMQDVPPRGPSLDARFAEALEYERSKRRRNLIWVGAVLAFAAVLGIGTLHLSKSGTATAADGTPVIARIDGTSDGHCSVGAKRAHCYRFRFTVLPSDGPPFSSEVDANVPDRFAPRIQPGSYVWVIRDSEAPEKVYLNVDALDEPAPAPPASR